jgi:hypothetical protein
MDLNFHFHEEDWERTAQNWNAWWAGELERPLVMIDGLDPIGFAQLGLGTAASRLRLSNKSLWNLVNTPTPMMFSLQTSAEEIVDAYTRLMSLIHFCGDSWPRWWFNYGPGMAAGFLGARVTPMPTTVWFDMPEPVDLHTWHPAYDPENPWWVQVKEVIRLAVERWGRQATVGFTDLGGNLDILASFRTMQNLLYDMYDSPEDLSRCAGELTQLWLRYYNELYEIIQQPGRGSTPWAHIWSPGRCYMLQSDVCNMISPKMFERFVLPDLEACCKQLDHAFYHLDGKGEIVHLEMLLSLKELRGIQWIPGDGTPPPEEWLPLLKRIRAGGKLIQLYVKPEGALKIVRELGGKGFAFYVNQPMTPGDARNFLRRIAAQ